MCVWFFPGNIRVFLLITDIIIWKTIVLIYLIINLKKIFL